MKTAALLLSSVTLLLATAVGARTKVQMNIIPSPPDCFTGPSFCFNVASACAMPDNSDCVLGTMSAKSKFKFNGKKRLKAKIKDVTDNTGALMTTGPADTATDNLVLKVGLSACPVDNGVPACDVASNLYLKVVLTDGDGSLDLDLASLGTLGAAGNPIAILGVRLLGAPANPGDCPGTNSILDIQTRVNDATCESSSVVRGTGGVLGE